MLNTKSVLRKEIRLKMARESCKSQIAVLEINGQRVPQPQPHDVRLLCIQEAQLSQRGRASLRVIEYFAKSLKIIRIYTVE